MYLESGEKATDHASTVEERRVYSSQPTAAASYIMGLVCEQNPDLLATMQKMFPMMNTFLEELEKALSFFN